MSSLYHRGISILFYRLDTQTFVWFALLSFCTKEVFDVMNKTFILA